ncbi:GspH/FimT family pseudopilin [Luteimonas terrae]|uniref:Type II secretion system protein H n=1 Tax=Luteimonas terrae TaxID=1530191 RepID=A0A4R5UER0_9GAMM|nr:prepilin-type N-terminal cleavage/methylation domain-containing protein [Luteimonas terrae]
MRRMRTRGFTLVELMVTIAIVAILAAIAFPSFRSVIRSNRLAGMSNEVTGALALARAEAIRSTRSAGVCGANAAGTGCVNGLDWSNGLLVWTNGDVATPDYDASSDALVRVIDAKPGLSLTASASSATGALANRVVFDSRGRATAAPVAGRTIVMRPNDCPSGQDLVRTFTLNPSGQIVLSRSNC